MILTDIDYEGLQLLEKLTKNFPEENVLSKNGCN